MDNSGFALQAISATINGFTISADCAVNTPSLVGLLGASGAGKSSLLSLIAGIYRPDNGKILINGRDITNEKPSARGVDYLFQDDNLFPHLNLMDNFLLGKPAITRAKALESLDMVGLNGFADKLPAQCSGGELKRAGLARILCRKRDLWLLDEPLSGLHPSLRRQLMADIKKLQTALNISVIITAHEPQLMVECDYCAFIRDGKMVIFDTPAVVLSSPLCADYL